MTTQELLNTNMKHLHRWHKYAVFGKEMTVRDLGEYTPEQYFQTGADFQSGAVYRDSGECRRREYVIDFGGLTAFSGWHIPEEYENSDNRCTGDNVLHPQFRKINRDLDRGGVQEVLCGNGRTGPVWWARALTRPPSHPKCREMRFRVHGKHLDTVVSLCWYLNCQGHDSLPAAVWECLTK